MIKLSQPQIQALESDWAHRAQRKVSNQVAGKAYREDMEAAVYEDDYSNVFLDHVNATWDTSDFDNEDLIQFIRDIQSDTIQNATCIPVSVEQYIYDKYDGIQMRFAEVQG